LLDETFHNQLRIQTILQQKTTWQFTVFLSSNSQIA